MAYSNIVAPDYTPKLIQIDKKRRFIILEYISGKPFSEDIKPERCDIQKAIEFVHYLNSDIRFAQKSITQNAADGFLRLSDHMKNIKTRFSSFDINNLPKAYHYQAKEITTILKQEIETTELCNGEDITQRSYRFFRAIIQMYIAERFWISQRDQVRIKLNLSISVRWLG